MFSIYHVSESKINQAIKRCSAAGQWYKVAEQYEKLVSLHPDNLKLRLKWADAYVNAGLKKEALDQYQWVGDKYLYQGELSRAISAFTSMLTVEESLTQVRVKLGELYAEQKDMEAAKEHFLTAIQQLENKRLMSQAIEVLQKIAVIFSHDPSVTIEIADMFIARKSILNAINQFLTAAEHYLQEKEITKACDLYRRVLDLDIDNEEAKIGLRVIRGAPPEQVEVSATIEKEEWKLGLVEKTKNSAIASEAPSLETSTSEMPIVKEILFEEDLDDLLENAQPEEKEWNDEEELRAHYDLGIVYREMALIDAAVDEFLFAAKDPQLRLKCYNMLDQCYMDKGMPRQAKKYRRKAEDFDASSKVGDASIT